MSFAIQSVACACKTRSCLSQTVDSSVESIIAYLVNVVIRTDLCRKRTEI